MTSGASEPLPGGPEREELDITAIASKMPDDQVADFLLAWEKGKRAALEATARRVVQTQRERFRNRLTVAVVVLVVLEAVVAIAFAAFDQRHWDTIKDGLAYAAAPVAVLVGAIGTYWYR